jgi:hypothetical protein
VFIECTATDLTKAKVVLNTGERKRHVVCAIVVCVCVVCVYVGGGGRGGRGGGPWGRAGVSEYSRSLEFQQ